MKNLLLVFLGGGSGSVLRYLVSDIIKTNYQVGAFPMGTLAVNVFGCFFMGLFSAISFKNDSSLRFFFTAGFCGGFTTFSSFSVEGAALYQSGNYFILAAYIFLSLFFGFLAVFIGARIVMF